MRLRPPCGDARRGAVMREGWGRDHIDVRALPSARRTGRHSDRQGNASIGILLACGAACDCSIPSPSLHWTPDGIIRFPPCLLSFAGGSGSPALTALNKSLASTAARSDASEMRWLRFVMYFGRHWQVAMVAALPSAALCSGDAQGLVSCWHCANRSSHICQRVLAITCSPSCRHECLHWRDFAAAVWPSLCWRRRVLSAVHDPLGSRDLSVH